MHHPVQDINREICRLVSQMSLTEKISLLSGRDFWSTMPIERLGIPSLSVCDGPHGVRTTDDGGRNARTTAFPTGSAMAATWNPELIEAAAAAMGAEARSLDLAVLLAPAVNIVRHPLAGRNFECFSEDPYLSGRLAVAYINGVQSQGVGTSLKHFACNSQEFERSRGNSVVDERTLREIYLPAFEMAVREAQPWTVMCGYNRINGHYCTENHFLLNEILREEWGFAGAVISDWGATHSTYECVKAGMDLEMPGPAKYLKLLPEAVHNWQIDEDAIDRSAARVLRLALLSGRMPADNASRPRLEPGRSVVAPEHVALARRLAAEAMVLLKNADQALPLDIERIRSVAVIGPNAAEPQISGGGSAEINCPHSLAVPLDALRERLAGKAEIRYEPGCVNYTSTPILSTNFLRPAQGSGAGLWAEYFNNADLTGAPVLAKLESNMNLYWFDSSPDPRLNPCCFSGRLTGTLQVPFSADYELNASCDGHCRIILDGNQALDYRLGDAPELREKPYRVFLERNTPYSICIEYRRTEEVINKGGLILTFGTVSAANLDAEFQNAVEAGAAAEVAIVFAGISRRYESEGHDRPDLNLPGRQNELVAAVAAVNPRTIVVLNTGAPYAMPWLNDVAAVLQAQLFGMEGGNAVADILVGKVNPSGKLPVTFPARIEDSPAFLYYPGGRDVHYGEGVFVGYRHYDRRALEPLFPFGFGLSYTTFEYSGLELRGGAAAGLPVTVTATIRNSGTVHGKEVVQVYVHDCAAGLPRPPRELKAFAKVDLAPGASTTVEFNLDFRAFAFYAPAGKGWIVEPGEFEIQLGSSSRDIRLWQTLELTAAAIAAATTKL